MSPRYVASLLAGLVQYQAGVEVDIIDSVLEEVPNTLLSFIIFISFLLRFFFYFPSPR